MARVNGLDLCGVPTPGMGPWTAGDPSEGHRPRYAMVDGLSVPDKELIEMHTVRHLSADAIGKKIKERPEFVRKRLRKLGVYNRGCRPPQCELDMDRVILLYGQGYSPKEIGAHLGGISNVTILAHLRKAGRVLINSRTPVGYTKAKIKYAERQGRDKSSLLKKFGVKKVKRSGRNR